MNKSANSSFAKMQREKIFLMQSARAYICVNCKFINVFLYAAFLILQATTLQSFSTVKVEHSSSLRFRSARFSFSSNMRTRKNTLLLITPDYTIVFTRISCIFLFEGRIHAFSRYLRTSSFAQTKLGNFLEMFSARPHSKPLGDKF